jgi:hypothetical protein
VLRSFLAVDFMTDQLANGWLFRARNPVEDRSRKSIGQGVALAIAQGACRLLPVCRAIRGPKWDRIT